MSLSALTDWWRSRALKKIAVKYVSQALAADALHFSTDIWSSCVVILGLICVSLADQLHRPWLRAADPVAALFVGGVVIYVSWRLARQTVDALLDAAPAGVRQKIIHVARGIPGVLEVDRARIRRGGNRYFVDLSIGLARTVTFQRSEQVAAEVTRAVRQVLADADVVVHTTAQATRSENIFDRVRAVATRNNFNVHDISVQALGRNQLHLEQHLELNENLSLREAHNLVTQLESEMRNSIPECTSILTHIESEPATIESVDQVERDEALEAHLQEIAGEFRPAVLDVHDVRVKRVRGEPTSPAIPPCRTICRSRGCTIWPRKWRFGSSRRSPSCFACSSTPSRRPTTPGDLILPIRTRKEMPAVSWSSWPHDLYGRNGHRSFLFFQYDFVSHLRRQLDHSRDRAVLFFRQPHGIFQRFARNAPAHTIHQMNSGKDLGEGRRRVPPGRELREQ